MVFVFKGFFYSLVKGVIVKSLRDFNIVNVLI